MTILPGRLRDAPVLVVGGGYIVLFAFAMGALLLQPRSQELYDWLHLLGTAFHIALVFCGVAIAVGHVLRRRLLASSAFAVVLALPSMLAWSVIFRRALL